MRDHPVKLLAPAAERPAWEAKKTKKCFGYATANGENDRLLTDIA